MLRAVIIDDEQKGINTLKLLIQKFINDVKVVAETIEPEKGVELIEDFKPEIVFLDINMPCMDGFQLLKKLNYKEFNLIFTTAHDNYAVKAIRSNAIDYLLKPIDIEDLELALAKVRSKIDKKQQSGDFEKLFTELSERNQKIPFNTKDKVEYIPKNEIIRLESFSNYTVVYSVKNGKMMISKTIGEYEQLLCVKESNFMRVHQSHIVNLQYVGRFTKDNGGTIITKDNCQIPLSKSKKDEFLNWLDIK